MIKISVLKNNVVTNSATFETQQEADEWLAGEISNNSFGLPERPELNELGEPTGNTLPAEYTIEPVDISAEIAAQNHKLKQFLRKNLYNHYQVNRMSAKATRIVQELFSCFYENTGLLPDEYQVFAKSDKARAVADYIAGMTDRFAIREHRRLFAVEEHW